MITGNFILLDAARMNDAIDEAKKLNPTHESLYKSKEDELLQSVAPFLFSFDNKGEFNNYFLDTGWGDSWGILINADVSFDVLHKHLRRFLIVKTEDGIELYFRFYDPRVLRIFLPTCDLKQLVEFFGPIQSFLMEDEDPRYGIKFSLQNGILQTRKIHLREIASNTLIADEKETEFKDANEVKVEETDDIFFTQKKRLKDNLDNYLNNKIPKPSKPKWNMLD